MIPQVDASGHSCITRQDENASHVTGMPTLLLPPEHGTFKGEFHGDASLTPLVMGTLSSRRFIGSRICSARVTSQADNN